LETPRSPYALRLKLGVNRLVVEIYIHSKTHGWKLNSEEKFDAPAITEKVPLGAALLKAIHDSWPPGQAVQEIALLLSNELTTVHGVVQGALLEIVAPRRELAHLSPDIERFGCAQQLPPAFTHIATIPALPAI